MKSSCVKCDRLRLRIFFINTTIEFTRAAFLFQPTCFHACCPQKFVVAGSTSRIDGAEFVSATRRRGAGECWYFPAGFLLSSMKRTLCPGLERRAHKKTAQDQHTHTHTHRVYPGCILIIWRVVSMGSRDRPGGAGPHRARAVRPVGRVHAAVAGAELRTSGGRNSCNLTCGEEVCAVPDPWTHRHTDTHTHTYIQPEIGLEGRAHFQETLAQPTLDRDSVSVRGRAEVWGPSSSHILSRRQPRPGPCRAFSGRPKSGGSPSKHVPAVSRGVVARRRC